MSCCSSAIRALAAVAPDIELTIRALFVERFAEPGVLGRRVVQHHIQHDTNSSRLRLGHQLVGHLLGGKQGLAHGLLGGAVLLHLVHQYLHLGLEGGVFLIERGVVRRQYVQKFIHHRHVIAAEGRLGKGVLGNFLWCQHNVIPPICSCLPRPMRSIGREPPLWHLPGNVDSPGIRVLAVPKRLKRRTPGGTTRTFSCPEEQFRNTARCSPVRQSDRLKYPRCRA